MKIEPATEDGHSSLEVEGIEISPVAAVGKVEDWVIFLSLRFQHEVEVMMLEDMYL